MAKRPSLQEKGDHLIGDYYVLFDQNTRRNKAALQERSIERGSRSKFGVDGTSREMLRDWEAGDEETVALWKRMNDWVYEGLDETYRQLGYPLIRYITNQKRISREEEVLRGWEMGFSTRRGWIGMGGSFLTRAGPQVAFESGWHIGLHDTGYWHC